MKEKKKRGRPPLAAQSLEAALQAVARGTAPNRPRNDYERVAAGVKPRGRRPSPHSITRIAAELAKYYAQQGMCRLDALKRACAEVGRATPQHVDMANVRRYVKKDEERAVVSLPYKGRTYPGFPTPAPMKGPLLHSVEEVPGSK